MAQQDLGMDASYGGGDQAAVKPPEGAAPADESVDEQNAASADVLIDKAKLPPGTKEGDTCTFKVVKDYGDECALQYVKEGKEEAGETPTAEKMDETTSSEIAALDEKE